MATVVGRYTVGNQAQRIRRAFSAQSLEGTMSVPGGHEPSGGLRGHLASRGMGQTWWQDLIKTGVETVSTRFKYGPGTVVQETEQGTIYYQQPEGTQPSLPVIPGPISQQQYGVQTPEGFATGFSVGTVALVGVGLLVFMAMSRRK